VFDGRTTVKAWGTTAPGPELVTNGGFGADTNWTKGVGWTISAGKASSDGSQSADSDLTQDIDVLTGELYEVTFTISGFSAGNVRPRVGTALGTNRAANGTFTEQIVCGAGGVFDLRADLNFVGSIDNVSVKLVNEGFDGATIKVQMLSEDGVVWIDVYTFTANGVQFGEVGSEQETFRAVVSGSTTSTNVSCTITQ
jgi:hypothetical protein